MTETSGTGAAFGETLGGMLAGSGAAAFIAVKYARDLRNHPKLRTALLGFVATSLFAAGVAGFFGAMLNKNAPVEGGQTIQLVQGAKQ